ncbi:MAG: RnfABCDGE type electron transport complex subunit G [Desulfobacula sp.]|nr:RnfABCDGE type electron transport complex subunit G [Desulfobacula sp.]
MREMISMIVVLTALTAVSGGLLAGIKSGTENRIEEQIFKFQLAPAMNDIFGEVENEPAKEQFQIEYEGMIYKFYPAKLEDGSTAVAFETKGKGGYGGDVGLMVGINIDNDQIVAARVTTHSETPGLGARAKDDPEFVTQFTDKSMDNNLNLKKNGGEIDAMSGATITSTAVSLAAVQAQNLYKKLKPEILKQIK